MARSGVRHRIALTCSSGIASPVALANGEVCLPRRALVELGPPEQDSMLAHEVAHIVRRDPHWLVVARVIEAVLFVQPLNRLARHRMQDVAEFLCDDWAVERAGEPVILARCLAAVAEWVERAPRLQPISAMVEAGGSPLVRRVGRILGDEVDRRAPSAHVAIGASVCALLALASIAPRVSVANALLTDRTVTFVRTIVEPNGGADARERVVLLRSRGGFSMDPLVTNVVLLRRRDPR
jgi:beta-lactamase regulating signal transducer with metallopeptidase domain